MKISLILNRKMIIFIIKIFRIRIKWILNVLIHLLIKLCKNKKLMVLIKNHVIIWYVNNVIYRYEYWKIINGNKNMIIYFIEQILVIKK